MMRISRGSALAVLASVLAVALVAFGQQTPSCTILVNPGESIQAAIDNAPDGAVICLSEGTWEENIKIEKSLTLRGAGQDETTINGKEEGYPVVWITSPEEATQTVSVKIKGLKITGAYGKCMDYGICADGVLVRGTAHVTLRACIITENRNDGIGLRDLAVVEISGCSFSKNLGGITLGDSARATLTACTISENKDHGITLWDSSLATITNCSFLKNGSVGIALWTLAEATISGCTVLRNSGAGVDLRYESQVVITDSIIQENTQGVWLRNSAQAKISSCSIARNYFNGILLFAEAWAAVSESNISDNRHVGIDLSDSSQVEISDCTISRNKDGIVLRDSSHAEITSCTIENHSKTGIASDSTEAVSGEGNKMSDNGVDLLGNLDGRLRIPLVEASQTEIIYPDPRFSSLQEAIDALLPNGVLFLREGEYQAGLTVSKALRIQPQEGADVTLQDETRNVPVLSLVGGARLEISSLNVSGGNEGILLSGNAWGAIEGCTLSENKWFGIELWNSAQVKISNCILSKNNRAGIWLSDSTQAVITNCTVSENKDYGIELRDSSRAEITGCSVSKHHYDGILLWYSAHAEITSCFISENAGNGIVLSDSSHAAITSCTVSENGDAGIRLRDSAQAAIAQNEIINNGKYGIALYQRPCFSTSQVFTGQVTGIDNVIPGSDEPDGNQAGALCPEFPGDPWPKGFLIEP